jgi:hypothetical protein
VTWIELFFIVWWGYDQSIALSMWWGVTPEMKEKKHDLRIYQEMKTCANNHERILISIEYPQKGSIFLDAKLPNHTLFVHLQTKERLHTRFTSECSTMSNKISRTNNKFTIKNKKKCFKFYCST